MSNDQWAEDGGRKGRVSAKGCGSAPNRSRGRGVNGRSWLLGGLLCFLRLLWFFAAKNFETPIFDTEVTEEAGKGIRS